MNDLNGYVKRMGYALEEKMFFKNLIDLNEYDLIVDFGCATGDLVRRIKSGGYRGSIVGYDLSEEMIELAKKQGQSSRTLFTTSIEQVELLLLGSVKTAVIFSSVLHEIEDKHDVFNFMKCFDTVIVRDMYFFDENYTFDPLPRGLLRDIRRKVSRKLFKSYENEWGRLTHENKNFYHFLLKYTYVDNWESEVKEDYFSADLDTLIDLLTRDLTLESSFEVVHDRCFTLPFKKKQVYEHFGFVMTLGTHRELIFKRV